MENVGEVAGEYREVCETPKSPPGDYNQLVERIERIEAFLFRCETPKSPPGDYNLTWLTLH